VRAVTHEPHAGARLTLRTSRCIARTRRGSTHM
jgi:hypothetical protein